MEKKVLIAEDEPNIAVSLEYLMQQSGYEIQTVTNGIDALRAAREFRPDLMLLDIRMPGTDGFALFQKLIQEKVPYPIIFITGHGDIPLAPP